MKNINFTKNLLINEIEYFYKLFQTMKYNTKKILVIKYSKKNIKQILFLDKKLISFLSYIPNIFYYFILF